MKAVALRSLVLKHGRARVWFVLAGLAFFVLGAVAWNGVSSENRDRSRLVARQETAVAAPAIVTVPPIVITVPPVVITVIAPTPATPPISIATTVAEGCCTVKIIVKVTYFYSVTPENMKAGQYRVITLSGRPPAISSGTFSDGVIQIPVGKEWIGQVEIQPSPPQSFCSEGTVKTTDLIGGPYGFKDRVISMGECQ